MHIYEESVVTIQDLAIEYAATLARIKQKIEDLREIGIDTTFYDNEVESIEKKIKNEIEKNAEIVLKISGDGELNQSELEYDYMFAISSLKTLEKKFEVYSPYFAIYHSAGYLNDRVNKSDLSDEELQEISNEIVRLVSEINNTDTRQYSDEKKVVEEVYSLAYLVMKLEIALIGRSSIFNLAQENSVVADFFSTAIQADIKRLETDSVHSANIRNILARMRGTGINYSYLNYELLQMISLTDNNLAVQSIRAKTSELHIKVLEKIEELGKQNTKISNIRRNIGSYEERLRKSKHNNKITLFKRIMAFLGAVVITGTSYILSRELSRNYTYGVTKESYSTTGGYSSSKEYKQKLSHEEADKLEVISYTPYKKVFGKANRIVTNYDISDMVVDGKPLEEYLKENFKSEAIDKSAVIEYKDSRELEEEEHYKEIIYEVRRILQDSKDVVITENTFVKWFFAVLFAFVGDGLFFIWLHEKTDVFDSLDNSSYYKERLSEKALELRDSVIEFKKILGESKELKSALDAYVEKYRDVLTSEGFQKYVIENADRILIDDPEKELTKREKKLVKVAVHKEKKKENKS